MDVFGDLLKVVTDEPHGSPHYVLDSDLRVRRVVVEDIWRAAHDRVAAELRLGHGVDTCPVFRKPWTVRVWSDGHGWQDVAVPPPSSHTDLGGPDPRPGG